MYVTRKELDSLLAYAVTLTGDRNDAFDLLQGCMEQYLGKVDEAAVRQPQAYLRRMIRNRFLDDRRYAARRRSDSFDEELHSPQVERDLESVMVDRMTVEAVWGELSVPEREVIHFWALEGMSASEIALHLAIPRGTVLSRMHRVRCRLAYYGEQEGNQNRR